MLMNEPSPRRHGHWRFFRAGGFDQVRIETAEDLLALPSLDQKLWVALSCPTRGIELDPRMLDFIDLDHDGRVRAPELLTAINWAAGLLRDPALLLLGDTPLPLEAINDDTVEGKRLADFARQLLVKLGKPEAAAISLDDTIGMAKRFAGGRFNGDGIVTPETADDPALAALLRDILGTVGGEPDRSGALGVSSAKAAQFYAEAGAYVASWDEAVAAGTMVLGIDTPAAAAALTAVAAKLDDFFLRCRLAAYDREAAGAVNRNADDYAALARRDLAQAIDELAQFPIALAAPDAAVPLIAGANPAWEGRLTAFRDQVARPLLGAEITSLDEAAWRQIQARFAPFLTWRRAQASHRVASLGIVRLRALLDTAPAIAELIARDLAYAQEFAAIAGVERLVCYVYHLGRLIHNFVSFRDFYSGGHRAVFQTGTLYLDGRSFMLCVLVDDVAKHAGLAALSRLYLVYCDCVRRGSADKITIAAAVTAGDSDQLLVGRNGVFYDRRGRDWDATIVKIIEHPIGIAQAFWAPYKRFGRMIGEQIDKLAAAKSKAVEGSVGTELVAAGQKLGAAQPAAPPAAFDIARFAGIFAAFSLAVSAIAAALGATITGLLQLPLWQEPLALIGVVLAISGPSVVIAYLKLRERNLGPILDANGWAVNSRARINIPFGAALTSVATLPPGAERSLKDPYAEKRRPWKRYIAVILVCAVLGLAATNGPGARWLDRFWHRINESAIPKS